MKRGGSDTWRTVVGVISDAKEYSSEKEPPIAVYYPFEQIAARNIYLVVRTTQDPIQMAGAITKEIQTVDAELAVFDVNSMEERLYDSLARRRFSMLLLGGFSVVALMLAAIGIYGVMSYAVMQRTREIGIRIALGAQTGQVLKLVLGQGIRLIAMGAGMGLLAAVGLTRVMSSLLFGVSATDPVTFAVIGVLLTGVALLACYVPARRAAKVEPMIALRYE